MVKSNFTLYLAQIGSSGLIQDFRRRMQYAAKLLTENRLSTSEIASTCGYGDPAYFRRLFSRTYGVTPHEYRESGGGDK